MTEFLSDFAAGIAQLMDAANIGTANPDGVYGANQVGITIQAMPETPDHIIAITPYVISDDPLLGDSVAAVQIRVRGDRDPRTVIDRDDAIFDLLEGIEGTWLNGIYVVVMWRQSNLPLPQDGNQRWEHSSTYYARVAWPTQHRTD